MTCGDRILNLVRCKFRLLDQVQRTGLLPWLRRHQAQAGVLEAVKVLEVRLAVFLPWLLPFKRKADSRSRPGCVR